MTFNDALSVFDHLLDNYSQNLTAGLNSIAELSPQLRDEVTALISAHEQNVQQTLFSNIIATQVDTLDTDKDLLSLTGEQIQHFKLKTLLGSGGMGVVYLAERCDGQLEQQVAIKIIAPSITLLTSKELAFKEAQYLARLNHPNIAKVYDVGTTESGLIYLIMEYIEGEPLQQFCATRTDDDILKLLIKICDAVSYSHQNRIIHGDLKPENVLVDKLGEPKLVDFGVAHTLSEQSNATYSAYINGLSRDYASPEQLAGEPLTTQSDVYSLGKVLERSLATECEELKSIIAHACDIKSQRYTNVMALAQDIERYCNIEPISLKSSHIYRGNKFIRRNPVTSMLGVSFIISLVAFSTALWQQNSALEKEQKLANHALEFMFDTFNQSNPEVNLGKPILAKDLLIKQQKKTILEFSDNPTIQYRLNKKIGDSLTALGEYESANVAYQQALSISTNQQKSDFWLISEIAENSIQLSQFSEADELLSSKPKSESALARYYLLKGRIQVGLENYKSADTLYNRALNYVLDHKQKTEILADQAINLLNLSRYQDSIKLRMQVLKILTTHYPEDLSSIANAQHEVSIALHNIGKYQESLEYALPALNQSIEIYSKKHPIIAEQMSNIANTYSELKQTQKAIDMLTEAKDVLQQFYVEPHTDVGFAHTYLGNAQLDLKQHDAAQANFQQALAIHKQLQHSDAHLEVGALNGLALVYRNTQQYEKAKSAFIDLLELINQEYGQEHPRRGLVLVNSIPVYQALGNKEQAIANGREAINIFTKQYGQDSHLIEIVQKRLDEVQSL
ncbi:protein kinase domain-containing protein [Pseudoalteromonas piscicida]|uniref:protein kinase domain-containing protein n=1 Tax=Pseudoalteromonas piscicida TaxID=43662 RepID=UPI0027E472D1|nr:tetratricopeptide repeat protein [Pseudoalteromonas piscicida]WMO12467.1 protein kinase [Pseudoalteromonas piscicida]